MTLFWEVGFPPQFPTGLGGFSSTRLPPSHALRVEFSKLPNRSHPTWVRSCLSPWGYSKKVLFLTLQGVGFPPQFPAGLGDFLLTAVYQTIILIFQFSLLSSYCVRRFFHQQSYWQFVNRSFGFLPQLFSRARRFFCINRSTGFPPLSFIGLGGFSSSTNSYTYTFDRVHTKRESNCNAEVTRPPITWLTDLIYFTTSLYLCIKSALASWKKEVLRVPRAQAR